MVREQSPDVVALSSYAWNENLTRFVLDRIKELDSSILTVESEPNFTVHNSVAKYVKPYFQKHSSCDGYAMDAGERPMVALLKNGWNLDVRLRPSVRQQSPG